MTALFPGHLKEGFNVLVWLFRTFIDVKARRYYRAIVFWTFLVRVMDLIAPWCIGLIAAAIATAQGQMIPPFVGLVTAHALRSYVDWRAARAREFFIGQAFRGLEHGMNQRFFEKDLGLHLDEHKLLSKSAMEKGRERADGLIHLITFWTADCVLALLITIPVLAYMNPMICMVLILGMGTSIAVSSIANRKVFEGSTAVEEEFRQILSDRDDRWDAVERVMTTAFEKEEVSALDERFRTMLSHDRPVWLGFIDNGVLRNGITTITLLTIVWMTGANVRAGSMSVGTFISIVTWVTVAIGQAQNLAMIERQVTWAISPIVAMRKALELPVRVTDREHPIVLTRNGPATIEFRNVTFGYRNAPPVLHDISFSVRPGEKVAIIGSSGSGKTTIGKLLLRYMDPNAGTIMVNGHDLRDVALNSWRKLAVPVRQGAQILDGTLRDNLLYGMKAEERNAMTDEELWKFMERFRINFGDRLTQGLETKLGKQGVRLSGGEAQRVMIGAAALRKPRLMIIDEATSALDAESQEAVQEALYELLNEGCSAIIIAHRLSTIAKCDRFIVLRGASKDSDTPQIEAIAASLEELAEHSPTFRSLAIKEGVLMET